MATGRTKLIRTRAPWERASTARANSHDLNPRERVNRAAKRAKPRK